jgi:integrase
MRGSIERRGKSWRIRVDVGRDPVTGRRRQLTRTVVGTKREAQEAMARLLVEVGEGRHQGTGSVTLAECCQAWFEHAEGNLQPNTAREFAGIMARYLGPRADVPDACDVLRRGLGGTQLRKLRAWDLDRFYDQMLRGGGREGRPLAPATVRRVHTVLRLALEQAVRWQWLAENPALHTSPPTVPRRTPSPPTAAQARRLVELAEAEDPEWAAYLRLAAALGARRGEVCALRWPAVNLDEGTVAIQRALVLGREGVIDREYPKTSASRRRVAIDPGTVAALVAHRRRQAEHALAVGTRPGPRAYVFSSEINGSRPWHPQVVTHRFERLRRRAGLSAVRLHDLRHYVATELISAGVDVRTVAGRLGHANPNVTLNTYAAWMPARDQEAAALIGSLLDRPGEGA